MAYVRCGAVLAIFLVCSLAGTVEASVKSRKLRTELTELKSRLAQLEGQLSYLLRAQAAGGGPARTPARPDMAGPWLPWPGGLCSDPCASDSDGDGIGDCEDICPCDASSGDDDGDGIPDCADPCLGDASNACVDPCRGDSDGDGRGDCDDPCPFDPAPERDGDADQIPDCVDPCPSDRKNGCYEPCPLDSDGDGLRDCHDQCPWAANEDPSLPCRVPPSLPFPPVRPPTSGGCVVSGCSGQLCTEAPGEASTCEWQPEYACYRDAACGRQADGKCGWAMTDELRECLAKARRPAAATGR